MTDIRCMETGVGCSAGILFWEGGVGGGSCMVTCVSVCCFCFSSSCSTCGCDTGVGVGVSVIQNSLSGSAGERKTDGLYHPGFEPRWRHKKLDLYYDDNYPESVIITQSRLRVYHASGLYTVRN